MLVKTIRCMQRCKSFKDLEFYNVFSRYCGHPKVL